LKALLLESIKEIRKMAKSNKYDYQLTQDNSTWSVKIVRRVTAKKSMVSKSQDGFASEAEAKEWGEKQLILFLEKLSKRNKNNSEKRK